MGNILCDFLATKFFFLPARTVHPLLFPSTSQSAKRPNPTDLRIPPTCHLVGGTLVRTGDLELVAWRWGFQQLGRDGFGSLDRQRQGGAAPRGARATVTLRIRTVL
jgi:hypothetical protein